MLLITMWIICDKTYSYVTIRIVIATIRMVIATKSIVIATKSIVIATKSIVMGLQAYDLQKEIKALKLF